ncbi:hypothetical protein NDU88_004397 [Pleurodeles waltl]|uniref:Uncharacterized protein n=1 Tax=Pleurodeles waltl TaxID=8319 RepID=A0AAV7QBT9_PLEWA|nr:hypothetical protein NDU88_004397 [Pleurodeles waltl]
MRRTAALLLHPRHRRRRRTPAARRQDKRPCSSDSLPQSRQCPGGPCRLMRPRYAAVNSALLCTSLLSRPGSILTWARPRESRRAACAILKSGQLPPTSSSVFSRVISAAGSRGMSITAGSSEGPDGAVELHVRHHGSSSHQIN